MRASVPGTEFSSREIERRIVSGSDKIVAAPNWTWFARRCWPSKTAANLAAIAGRDKRTAERWLSGEFDPPNTVMAALIAKMFERGF